MLFDERSHPNMCHAMWGCLRAHTHLSCQQNLRRRLWSKGGLDFFNSAQSPVKDQTVWINDCTPYSSTIAPLEDYFPKLLGVSRSQKYHFHHHGIFQTRRWPPRLCRTSISRVCHGWPGFPCSQGWLPIWSSMLGHPSCCGELILDVLMRTSSMIGSCWWEEVPYSEKFLLKMSFWELKLLCRSSFSPYNSSEAGCWCYINSLNYPRGYSMFFTQIHETTRVQTGVVFGNRKAEKRWVWCVSPGLWNSMVPSWCDLPAERRNQ